jgi:trypsin-like peptidase
MTLVETYQAVAPSVVAFVSRFVQTKPGEAPIVPPIFGTGFLVDQDGIVVTNRHVADCFEKLPTHPKTGDSGYAALMFQYGASDDLGPYLRLMIAEIAGHTTLGQFASDSQWFGEEIPDIAFVQLKLMETPFLKLANHDFYVRPGTPIATVGFPMGDVPLVTLNKPNQLTPFIRRGIVSSVFPYAIPHPHGLTIDIMQQGGSSGSPIFYDDQPVVVGMMAASMVEPVTIGGGALTQTVQLPTNISIAVPSHLIEGALQSFKSTYQIDRSAFPTLEEWQKAKKDKTIGFGWDVLGTA